MSLLTDADLAIASDPLELISRFTIKSKAGPRVSFDDPFPEQIMLLRDWWDPDRRQIPPQDDGGEGPAAGHR